ncbi:hypothetical protein OG426_37775 [Streptomyces canus]|uniref:hypothetical protein n=1 Tax=Streptomyces canus TaxID=58343 RepID=UPI0022595411|nr:hypothetical protein [Streptomyces canus]MCX4856821.1 hypothetical protein [Streptomyces canus]WSW37791.1 hypothetical protein OG426_37775 [Streptomyces canus]
MIKVTIEADPAEMPALLEALAAHGAEFSLRSKVRPAERSGPALDPAVLDLLRTRAPAQQLDRFVSFVETELREHGAVAELGTDKTSYVKLYVPGPRKVGAYCYVRPDRGYLDFRVPIDAADGCRFAYARDVQPDNAHPVRCPLTKADALPEAHRLSALAREIAQNA